MAVSQVNARFCQVLVSWVQLAKKKVGSKNHGSNGKVWTQDFGLFCLDATTPSSKMLCHAILKPFYSNLLCKSVE